MYTLTADEAGQHLLEVWCGGLAMQKRVLMLSGEDVSEYNRIGILYLDRLALLVCRKRGFFEERTCARSARPPSPES